MSIPFEIPVTMSGMLAAVALVIAGGPLFAGGLRAMRQRRLLKRLSPSVAENGLEGFVRLEGTVALESPLFSPLSQRPCAGYRLEVHARDSSAGGAVGQQRGFRLVGERCDAFVEPSAAAWAMPVTAEREVPAGEQVSANMAALLEGDAILRWLRDRRAAMRIVERSIEAGARVEVVGYAHTVAVEAEAAHEALAATGTDGFSWAIETPSRRERPPLRLGAHEPLGLHVVADGSTDPVRFAAPAWRMVGLLLGPLCSLAGLVYLVQAAGAALGGRF